MVVKVSVIGLGYLGATHATAMAELGHEVIGIEIDSKKLEQLSGGSIPFHEPGLEQAFSRHLSSGHIKLSSDFASLASADLHFICVGTDRKSVV